MCDKHTLHPFGGRHAKNKTYRAFVQTSGQRAIVNYEFHFIINYELIMVLAPKNE